jgi:hypothetical protein
MTLLNKPDERCQGTGPTNIIERSHLHPHPLPTRENKGAEGIILTRHTFILMPNDQHQPATSLTLHNSNFRR